MLYIEDAGLDPGTERGLKRYQSDVDSAGTYPQQVTKGKDLFRARNRESNSVFKAVRARLRRAQYTIEVLKLNRDVLLEARREAYGAYRARLLEYRDLRDGGAEDTKLGLLTDAVMSSSHPTVWREMQRQHTHIGELRALFLAVPEAKRW